MKVNVKIMENNSPKPGNRYADRPKIATRRNMRLKATRRENTW
jgi:hypothetical protein